MKLKFNVLFTLGLFLSQLLVAQNPLDTYFNHLAQHRKMMGTVSISFKDSIIYSKALGYANVETKRLLAPHTPIRIASITKTFTAVLVLKAVEENKLNLNTKLASYYPEFINADKISILNLLNHRSGIFNFTAMPDALTWQEKFHTQAEFLDYIKDQPSLFEPGSQYAYSNTNYALLGFILEKVYNMPFADILQTQICQPLGLKYTYYSAETNEDKGEALSYAIHNQYLRNEQVNFSNHPASGGMVSTANELNQFLSALFGGRILSNHSLQEMLPKTKGEYGLGIEKLEFTSPEGFTHTGRVENYLSEFWYFPKEKLGIVSIANALNIYQEDIHSVMLGYAYGNKVQLPNFNQIEGLSEAEFAGIAGSYRIKGKDHIVTISSDGTYLIFQNSRKGQMYIPFTPQNQTTFNYGDVITLEFFPKKKKMKLVQGQITEWYRRIK